MEPRVSHAPGKQSVYLAVCIALREPFNTEQWSDFFFPNMFVSPVIQGASNPRAVFARKSHTVHTAALAGYFWLAFPCKPWPFAVIWREGVAP